jgi:hypothetical protein
MTSALRPSRLLPAAQAISVLLVAPGRPAFAQAADPAPLLQALEFQGGTPDDQVFARSAAALGLRAPLDEAGFRTALEAIRATDRFRRVDGQLQAVEKGVRALVRLDPWPALEKVRWETPLPGGIGKVLPGGPRGGERAGNALLDAWQHQAQLRLAETGYPQARLTWRRLREDRELAVAVDLGAPSLIRKVAIVGDRGPYADALLLSWAGIRPGSSLWTPATPGEINRRLRKRFRKDSRFEAAVEAGWDGKETLRLRVQAGPLVRLKAQGSGLGLLNGLSDFVPLGRAERYSPQLLDEGERRLVRFFRNKGYLDVQVGYRREVTRQGPECRIFVFC